MTHFINLWSVKGGQGTTTTAVLLAKQYVTTGKTVLLVDREGGDIAPLVGITTPDVGTITPVITGVDLFITDGDIEFVGSAHDVIICDLGHAIPGYENILVTMPDYISLRRAIANADIRHEAQSVIIVRPDGRVLSDEDVKSVLGLRIHSTINMSVAVARASDAGLLMSTSRDLPVPSLI